jgi:SpoVK/Ycf46/Vps4 family AAA+-type ATPase
MSLLNQFLSDENYSSITKRLKENKMKPGMTVLLYGHPGTGKTESVYQLAKRSKRNIVQVNISEIKDMWVGESEKNIKAIFDNYRKYSRKSQNMPILLFNESDALIGKRYNVTHSVDQMNNSMQNILLQELEEFNGILIATTNLLCNLDEAFDRRFLYKVKFLEPDIEAKKQLWKEKLNFLSDEDCELLANDFEFSGGQIDNISKKVFLDSLLRNYEPQLKDVINCCNNESLSNSSGKNIGFSSLTRNTKLEDSEF